MQLIPEKLLRLAKAAAAHSTMRHRHGAAALITRGCVRTGWNWRVDGRLTPSARKRLGFHLFSVHAEVEACLSADSPIELIVVRLRRDGSLGNSKPCTPCVAFLIRQGVKKIYYSLDNGEFEVVKLR
jgi:deoxycytidylate deaminase